MRAFRHVLKKQPKCSNTWLVTMRLVINWQEIFLLTHEICQYVADVDTFGTRSTKAFGADMPGNLLTKLLGANTWEVPIRLRFQNMWGAGTIIKINIRALGVNNFFLHIKTSVNVAACILSEGWPSQKLQLIGLLPVISSGQNLFFGMFMYC